MIEYCRDGEISPWYNDSGADIVSGAPVVMGKYGIGIATVNIASTATGNVQVHGVVKLIKPVSSGNTFSFGDPVYITLGAGTATAADKDAATGLYFAGRCVKKAAQTDPTVECELLPFAAEGAREITLAATGNQVLAAADFLNGSALTVKVPNTGALSVTFPLMSTVPNGMPVLIVKTAADAAAITIAANASDSLVGSTGTVDAANDRVLLFTKSGGPIVVATVIA